MATGRVLLASTQVYCWFAVVGKYSIVGSLSSSGKNELVLKEALEELESGKLLVALCLLKAGV